MPVALTVTGHFQVKRRWEVPPDTHRGCSCDLIGVPGCLPLDARYADMCNDGKAPPAGCVLLHADLLRCTGLVFARLASGVIACPQTRFCRWYPTLFVHMQAILKDPNDRTRVRLIFANQAEEDILLREELDAWARDDERVEVHHILSRAADGWQGSRGRCSEELFQQHLFPSGKDALALLCGPQAMVDQCCIPCLTSLGFEKSQIVVF